MVNRDQERLRQSTDAYHTLGRVALEIAQRLDHARSAAAPQAPRRPGQPSGRTDGPADPVHAQVAQLEDHLRSRGGPLHRVGILLAQLDQLAAAIDADHRLPPGFTDRVANLRRRPDGTTSDIRRGPVGARLHTLGPLADDIGQQLTLLNEAIFDAWRSMWRTGQGQEIAEPPPGVAYSAHDDQATRLEQALLAYVDAASYAAGIAATLRPYHPVVDDRARCSNCGYRLVKYGRLKLCGTCYERGRRATG